MLLYGCRGLCARRATAIWPVKGVQVDDGVSGHHVDVRSVSLAHHFATWIVVPHPDCELRMKVPASSVVWKT